MGGWKKAGLSGRVLVILVLARRVSGLDWLDAWVLTFGMKTGLGRKLTLLLMELISLI